MQGLWDQGLFTDALISAIRAEHIYPFTYLQVSPPDPAVSPAASLLTTFRSLLSHHHASSHAPPPACSFLI